MNLKTQTDYALRVLLYLASRDEMTPVERIAGDYRISREHLVKVVQHLARLGYVRTYAGRNGGVRLARKPETIVVSEVIASFEGRNGVLECVAEPSSCILEPGCVLRHLLIKAESAFYETLNVSVADLVGGNIEQKSGGVYNLPMFGRMEFENDGEGLRR